MKDGAFLTSDSRVGLVSSLFVHYCCAGLVSSLFMKPCLPTYCLPYAAHRALFRLVANVQTFSRLTCFTSARNSLEFSLKFMWSATKIFKSRAESSWINLLHSNTYISRVVPGCYFSEYYFNIHFDNCCVIDVLIYYIKRHLHDQICFIRFHFEMAMNVERCSCCSNIYYPV